MVSGSLLTSGDANLSRTRPSKFVDAGVLSPDMTGIRMAAVDSEPEDVAIPGLCLQYDEARIPFIK